MTVPEVKVCCIASLAEAQAAVSLGAAALGLVSQMPSGPGVIEESLIARIAAEVAPPVQTFLLTAARDVASVARQHARCGTTTLQLVDTLLPGEGPRLRYLLPTVRLVQVIHVMDDSAVQAARDAADWAHALLLDSGNPTLAVKELGGTGRVHDWTLSRRIRDAVAVPVYLAGGLRPQNVAAAIRTVRPFGLDLCSGVRREGRLCPETLAAFMAAVRSAA